MTINFLNPAALSLILLVPLLAGFLIWRIRSRRHTLAQLGDPTLLNRLISGPVVRPSFWRIALWTLVLINLIIALARPAWGVNMDVVELQGVSVVAVLDVSNSMAAQDMIPSRLDRAKLALHDLFDGLEGQEVGLVIFAGSALVQFPLTSDANSAKAFLGAASTQSITQQGTAIDKALRTAIGLFDPQSASARIIVLMTDGENHEGDLTQLVEEADAAGIVVYTLGFGDSEGVPIPVLDNDGQIVTYKADAAGDLVLSQLDEATLQMIAEQTGGAYWRSSAGGTEIATLIQRINASEQGVFDSRVEARSIERFGIFTLLAIIALTLEIFAPTTHRESA